jgi:hypothetical protein
VYGCRDYGGRNRWVLLWRERGDERISGVMYDLQIIATKDNLNDCKPYLGTCRLGPLD